MVLTTDSHLLLDTVLESTTDIIVVLLDKNADLVYFNETWRKATTALYGTEPQAGMSIYDCMLGTEDIEKSRKNILTALSGQKVNIIQEYGDSRISYFDIDYSPVFNDENKINGIVIFAKDITERELAKQNLQKALDENRILLRELRHRVKNNLNMILGILDLQMIEDDSPQIHRALDNVKGRIGSITSLYESLQNNDKISEIKLDGYLKSILETGIELHASLNDKIKTVITADAVITGVETALPLGIITNELLTNAYKYAFGNRENGTLSLSLIDGDKTFVLEISDDGSGFGRNPEHQGKNHLGGLELVQSLADQIGADFEMETGHGSRFRLTVPKESRIPGMNTYGEKSPDN